MALRVFALLALGPSVLAKEFIIGADSTNACPAGYENLKDEAECKRAMAALGRSPWGRVDTWEDHPVGCFNNPTGVFLNSHATGGTKAGRAPICKEEAKATKPEEEYIMAADGTNVCPDTYSQITDEPTCKRAMTGLGKGPWGRIDTWTNHPGGCFNNPNGVYLNTHSGAPYAGRASICMRYKGAAGAAPAAHAPAPPPPPPMPQAAPAQAAGPGAPAKPSGTPWPDCQEQNTVIRNAGQALFADMQAYGAAIGCYLDDCVHTDKFVGAEIESCVKVCHTIPTCKYWVWGMEDGENKCWFRSGDAGREAGEGWISGAKTCVPPGTTALPMGNDECWTEGFGYPECCDDKYGPNGNAQCWDGVFNYDRCCFPKDEL